MSNFKECGRPLDERFDNDPDYCAFCLDYSTDLGDESDLNDD